LSKYHAQNHDPRVQQLIFVVDRNAQLVSHGAVKNFVAVRLSKSPNMTPLWVTNADLGFSTVNIGGWLVLEP
jgi:hypothetical protein